MTQNNSQWPGSSPDLNVAENLGAILKDRVDASLFAEPEADRLKQSVLLRIIETELTKMSGDTELFERLLRSYPKRIKAVVSAGGGHTEY